MSQQDSWQKQKFHLFFPLWLSDSRRPKSSSFWHPFYYLFRIFFRCGPLLNSLLNLLQYCFCFILRYLFCFVFQLQGKCDLSSLIKTGTSNSYAGRQSLNPLDRQGSRSLPHSHSNSGGGNGNPLQYSCLESPTDRGARWATVQGGSQRVGHH